MSNEQLPAVNRNPVKPGDAKRGRKPIDPATARVKRTVYLTDAEWRAYSEWLASIRMTDKN